MAQQTIEQQGKEVEQMTRWLEEGRHKYQGVNSRRRKPFMRHTPASPLLRVLATVLCRDLLMSAPQRAHREALFAILCGKEREPTAPFNISGSTIEKNLTLASPSPRSHVTLREEPTASEFQESSSFLPLRSRTLSQAKTTLHRSCYHRIEFRSAEMASANFYFTKS